MWSGFPAPGVVPATTPAPATSPASAPATSPAPAKAPAITPGAIQRILTNAAASVFSGALFNYPFQTVFRLNPGAVLRPGGRVLEITRNAPQPRPESWRDPAETTLRKDHKTAGQLSYIQGLAIINQTIGKFSEAVDFYQIMVNNLIVDGAKLSGSPKPAELAQALMEAEAVDLDVDRFLGELFAEQVSDAMIGALSQAEKKLLRRYLGDSHLINNVVGNPTTWAGRITGENPLQGVTDSVKPVLSAAQREIEAISRTVRKLDEELEDAIR